MSILEQPFMKEFIRTCDNGWLQGWHERNGGNLTYRMKPEEVEAVQAEFCTDGPWVALGIEAPSMANAYFLSTGSGKYMMNVKFAPEDALCVAQLNEKGDAYRIVWGLVNGGVPTSEFPTHIMNHAVRAKATDGECRVIYHAHPNNIIAMSYILPVSSREVTRELWKAANESPVVFPGGVGVVPWMVPGGAEIAHATCKLMEEFDAAVWVHHGLFVSGSDFDTAFGLMNTIENSADIYMKICASGKPVLQTLSDDDIRAIGRRYNVKLREEFLD